MESNKVQGGFTFLEMVIVLGIVSLISLIGMSVFPLYDSRKDEQFLEQFRQDIVFMQQAAISNNSRYSLRWFTAHNKYIITSGDMKVALVREYDPEIKVELVTLSSPMTYNANGNINKGGMMYVFYKQNKYKVVFQLGRGRFSYYKI
ncbi:MAG: competence type IV pilus minor pilin ComGD [Ectobacillus sp.]